MSLVFFHIVIIYSYNLLSPINVLQSSLFFKLHRFFVCLFVFAFCALSISRLLFLFFRFGFFLKKEYGEMYFVAASKYNEVPSFACYAQVRFFPFSLFSFTFSLRYFLPINKIIFCENIEL